MMISEIINHTIDNHSICYETKRNSKVGKDIQLSNVDIFYTCLYSTIFGIGFFGNIIVIWWFSKPMRRKRAGSVMVITLATNDMLASIVIPSLRIYSIIAARTTSAWRAWYLERVTCYTIDGMNMTFVLATSWILVIIAGERYRYVHEYEIVLNTIYIICIYLWYS